MIDINDKSTYFKVNLPFNEDDFNSGNGEGCWACCSKEDMEKMDKDIPCYFTAKILNDSLYYPNIKYGMEISCMFMGNRKRPVADIAMLQLMYGKPISEEEKRELLEKVWECMRARI